MWSFREHFGIIQGTFDIIQGTFDIIQGTFDIIQGMSYRERVGAAAGKDRALLEDDVVIQGTFWHHSGKIWHHSGNIWHHSGNI
jgi:hypothetical protein